MAQSNLLSGWVIGAPPVRDDGALAIIELQQGVKVDGGDHHGLPLIVACWSGKLTTTAGGHRIEYADVLRYIDIAIPR